ncbi:MAG: 6-phosphogluconolactonase [Nocardioides sp.]
MTALSAPRIEVHGSAASLASAVAGALVARLVEAQANGREPQVALTGGTIADAVNRELARLSGATGTGPRVDWSRVGFWWGDERFVPADSPDRNALAARRAFLDVVGADPAKVHEIGSADAFDSVTEAAAAYGNEVRTHGSGGFEVVLLGVGPDGHVASLFPGRAEVEVADRVAVGLTDSPKPPPERVSLTLPALNRTLATWLVVSGEEKAGAVATALGGGLGGGEVPASLGGAEVPAARVRGGEETVWFLDRPAASHL